MTYELSYLDGTTLRAFTDQAYLRRVLEDFFAWGLDEIEEALTNLVEPGEFIRHDGSGRCMRLNARWTEEA